MINEYYLIMCFEESLKKYLSNEEINNLISSFTKERSYCLLINTNKTDIDTLKKYFKTLTPHPFIPNAYYYDGTKDFPGKSFLFDNGAYYIIDASSLLVSHFLEFDDNDLVLDLCAAPGGKSISSLLKSKKIMAICNDLNKNRAFLMSQNFERLGISNAIVTSNDFTKIHQNFKNVFDKIILDAPCSGSGMFRKNEDMQKDRSIEKVNRCAKTQKELIEIAFNMLKDGGILSYSTCSFNYEENEEVILDFLKSHQDAKLLSLPHFEGEYRSKTLKEAIHLFPSLYNGEGMFICQIQKNNGLLEGFPSKKTTFKTKSSYQKAFNLNFNFEECINNKIYLYDINLNLSSLYIINKGLLLGELKGNILVPSFHLAHFLSPLNSINLDDNEFKLYIHGDSFKYNKKILKDGFYVVSYDNINLGFIKSVNNTFKNFYPKGLRH